MPPRNVVEDLSAVEEMMKRNITGLDIVGALSRSGEDIASNILNMLRQRVTGDYLQTSAILDRQFEVVSAVNDIMTIRAGHRLSHLCRTLGGDQIFRAWFSPTPLNKAVFLCNRQPIQPLYLKTREGG